MSLATVIAEIATDMEKEAEDGVDGARILKLFARQLRIALKASEGQSQVMPVMLSPEAQHRQEIEKAKGEFRKGENVNKASNLEEGFDGIMTEVVQEADNEEPPMFLARSPQMPVGASMSGPEGVYTLGPDFKLYPIKKVTLEVRDNPGPLFTTKEG